jgi:putative transposase
MSRRKYTPEQIISKLREVEVALAQGATVALAVRDIEVTEQTYYRCVESTVVSLSNRPNA